jgi:two-component system cell cycle sensor histidine kinase/response regulator CckA
VPIRRPQEAARAPNLGALGGGNGLEARTNQLSLLVEINAELAGALDAEAVLGPILTRLVDRQRLAHALIYRLDLPARELQCVACDAESSSIRKALPLEEPNLVSWVIQERQAVYVPHVDQDPRCQGLGSEIECGYVVPLQTSSSLLGVLEIVSHHPDGIRAVTRKLIDQVATQAALALERSELYRQLQVSEERFRSIFEQGCFGVALAGLDGRFSTVNPAFARMLGYTQDELQGRHFQEITHPEDIPKKQEVIRTLLEGWGAQCSQETRYLRKSGEALWCSTNISLIHDAAGRPAYFLGMLQDVDERKKAEAERGRLQQQLFQAQKMEALGTLAGGIAHDFNNLLSVMLGFASLARQRLNSDDPLQESMGMIEQSAQRAADLTRQLLGLARPERQQVKPVCVGEVLDRVQRMVTRTFDRNIKVSVVKRQDALWVKAEPSYLEQAILNLAINARDAMPEGGSLTFDASVIAFQAHEQELPVQCAPGRYVQITVQDTGLGIPPDALPRIFEPFYSTKAPGKGTGLGLAMVYGFVKNHDGFVRVESEVGKGTRFTINLPMIPAPTRQAGIGLAGRIQRGTGTILVVDDEPLVRAFAEQGLKGLGYKVWAAESGQQALEIYAHHNGEIDCVLLDLIMPEIGGLETFRRLRILHPQVRVVFASGYSTGEILREAPDAQEAGFIGKPYTLEGLSIALRKAGVGGSAAAAPESHGDNGAGLAPQHREA